MGGDRPSTSACAASTRRPVGRARSAFSHSATGQEFGKIESKGFEGPGPTVSPCEPVMSSQELIEEILLDAVRASGLVDVRFAVEATRARERRRGLGRRGRNRGHRSHERRIGSHPRRRARRSGWRRKPHTQRARSEARGAARPVAHRQLLFQSGYRTAHRRSQRRVVLRRQRGGRAESCSPSTVPDAGSARSVSRRKNGRSTSFTKARARDWVRAAVGVERSGTGDSVARPVEDELDRRGAPRRRGASCCAETPRISSRRPAASA